MNDLEELAVYDGELPMPKAWATRHIGQAVAVRYVMSLDDLIEVEGLEGMNDYLDAVMSVEGAALTDISYEIALPGKGESLDDQSVLIQASGVLEEY